jgi:hypothetical protein
MWILTIPSFTWIQIDTSKQSVPPARAGHTCNIWNSQMVVLGGYVGTQLECDSPGIYVFNTSSLSWQNEYVALKGGNVLNNQKAQQDDPSALQGSYGYDVPGLVQSVIGGNALGKATVTSPAQSAVQGPLATGRPVTYTVTGANGAVSTETGTAGSGSGSSNANNNDNNSPTNNTGAIVAGVIAGCFALLSAYLAFCAWIYRRQLKLYKNHVAMAQRAQLAGGTGFLGGVLVGKRSNEQSSLSLGSNGNPQRLSDEPRGGGYAPLGAGIPLGSNNPYHPASAGRASARSSTDDLLHGNEPSFIGVLLNPRRSLRVVNRD